MSSSLRPSRKTWWESLCAGFSGSITRKGESWKENGAYNGVHDRGIIISSKKVVVVGAVSSMLLSIGY